MKQMIRYASVCVFALVLVCCGALTSAYDSIQAALVLEGNNLYTHHAVIVAGNFDEVSKQLSSKGLEYYAFRDIENEPFTRALYSSNYEAPKLPLHERTARTNVTDRQAWVGSLVTVDRAEHTPHKIVNGTSYRVTAALGLRPNSLLAEQTIVCDPSLFRNYEGPFILDGPEITQHMLKQLNIEFTHAPAGTSHRTNVDFITPVILTLNVLLISIGGTTFGAYTALLLMPRNAVLRIVGYQQSRIFARTMAEVLLPVAGAAAVALVSVPVMFPQFNTALMGQSLIILTTCAAAGLTVVWGIHAKGKRA